MRIESIYNFHPYAFGMEMNGRKWQGTVNDYRFGMNTQEKNSEIYQGAYGAMYWEYDSRIGRRWNLDPKGTIGVSDYACFLNSPIQFTDPDGDVVKFENAKAFFKAMGKAIVDKEFRKKLIAQHRATITSINEVKDSEGRVTRTGEVTKPAVFRYTYNEQSEIDIETAVSTLGEQYTKRIDDGAKASNNKFSISFSDSKEKLSSHGASGIMDKGGPKSSVSKQMYKSGFIEVTWAGAQGSDETTVSFYQGGKIIENSTFKLPKTAGEGPNSSLLSGKVIPFTSEKSAKIRMVISNPARETKDPGAYGIKATINRTK